MIPALTKRWRDRLQARANRTGKTLYVYARPMAGGLAIQVATKCPKRVAEFLAFCPFSGLPVRAYTQALWRAVNEKA